MSSARSHKNGKPYYCNACGMGYDEFLACELPDCDLETEAQARKRCGLDETGEQLRDAGMKLAATPNSTWLERARQTAEALLQRHALITVEHVREAMQGDEPSTPNAWGSVFKHSRFTSAGYTQSKRKERHAGAIAQWRLTE